MAITASIQLDITKFVDHKLIFCIIKHFIIIIISFMAIGIRMLTIIKPKLLFTIRTRKKLYPWN
jgi:hypothetical protein